MANGRNRTKGPGTLLGTIVLTALLAMACTAAFAASGFGDELVPSATAPSGRTGEIETLRALQRVGGAFALEELVLLNRYEVEGRLTELEADILLSRALYDYYVACTPLSKEQEFLLDAYQEFAQTRTTDVADRKARLLADRQAYWTTAPPRREEVAPANDLCAGAEAIPGAGPFPYLTAITADITDATETAGDPAPSCQTSHSRSIWYTFTPAATGSYTIQNCADAPTGSTVDDTVLAIFTSAAGCAGAWTQVACDDDSCTTESLQSVFSTNLTAGTTYYILSWLYGATAPTAGNTAIQLRVSQNLPPANDQCGSALPLTLNVPLAGTMSGTATNDYILSGAACFTGVGQTTSTAPGRDVAYTFTAPSAGNYSFKVYNYSNTASNLVLYLASSCPAGAPPITVATCLKAANRTTATAEEINCVALTAAQQVWLFVDENTATTYAETFTVLVTACTAETEPNGTPATANPYACETEGGITPAAEVDFFSLGTPAAGSRIFAMADGIAASSTDFDLRITTATDTLEYDDAGNDTPFGSLAPNCSGTPLTGVASYLRVSHYSAATQAEPYRLYAIVQPPIASATAETEPNDAIATANAGSGYFSGTMTTAGDIDLFRFAAAQGDLIVLGLDTDPLRNNTPFNGALALLDSAGAVLVTVNDGGTTSSTTASPGTLTGTTPNSPGEALTYRVPATGIFYARVTWSSGLTGATADYLLSIALNCAVPSADIAVSKIGLPDPVIAGQNLTYTIAATNGGPSLALNPSLSDPLPAGTTFVSLTPPAGWTCTTPAVGSNGTVSCTSGTLAMGGAPFTLVVAVAPSVAGGTILSNTATLSSQTADATPANNTVTATTTVSAQADLSVTKTGAPNPVAAGQNITYTITVSNAGPSDAAGVSLSDLFPPGLTFVSQVQNTGPAFTLTNTATSVTDTLASFAAGASASFTVVVNVPAAASNGTIYNNAVNVTATTGDPNPGNNSASASTTVSTAPVVTGISPTTGPTVGGTTVTITGSAFTGATAVNFGATPAAPFTVVNAGQITATAPPHAAGTVDVTVTTPAGTSTVNAADQFTYTCATIIVSPATLPGGLVGTAYNQTLTAAGGFGPYAYAVTAGALPGGLTLASGGALTGTPTTAGSFNFTVTATDSLNCAGSQAYTVLVCSTITVAPATLPNGFVGTAYSQTITASGGTGPYTFAVTAGALPGGLTLAPGGGLTGTPAAAGLFTFTITATDANGCTGSLAYSVRICPVITLSPATLPAGLVGTAYNQTVTASGGTAAYTFAVTAGALPGGLTLAAGGALMGAPTAAGLFNFTITATDANGCTGSLAYSVRICPVITVAPATLPNGLVGTAYSQTVTASGGTAPYTFAVTAGVLPGGLTLAAGGALTGTPTTAGLFNVTVTATDANGCAGSLAYSVRICPAITLSPASLPGGLVGSLYSQTITASGGTGPYTFAVTAGALPGGLTLAAGGVLTGSPTANGTFTFTVTATDANGCTGSASYTIVIAAYDLTFFDDYSRSQLCVNSTTGAFAYTVLLGVGAGTYTGAGTVTTLNGQMTLATPAGLPYSLTLKYLERYHKATASYTNRPLRVLSQLTDNNTLNDPPVCAP